MAKQIKDDKLKEKFRPQDSALDREIEAALQDVSLDELYRTGEPASAGGPAAPRGSGGSKGPRRGKIISIDAKKDEVFVDFGSKSQGVAKFSQFDAEPKVGDELEFFIEKYDPREGLLILNKK